MMTQLSTFCTPVPRPGDPHRTTRSARLRREKHVSRIRSQGHSPSRRLTARVGWRGVHVRRVTSEPCHGHQRSLSIEVAEGRASGEDGVPGGLCF